MALVEPVAIVRGRGERHTSVVPDVMLDIMSGTRSIEELTSDSWRV